MDRRGRLPPRSAYERLQFAGYIEGALNGILVGGYYFTGLGESPFDPDEYRLILKDGTAYDYSETEGLQHITDPNGNRLDFTNTGIFHYPAGESTPDQSIEFERDAEGRITEILDPNDATLRYTYDAAGDLRSFTDQRTTSRRSYHARRAHYLDTIVDPGPAGGPDRIRRPAAVAVIDAPGHRVEQGLTSTRGWGLTRTPTAVTTQYFDERGNIIKTVDPTGAETEFQFDANNNEVWRRTRAATSQRHSDARGNVTQPVDANVKPPQSPTTRRTRRRVSSMA
jgi:YD repeat-containing protein